MLCIQQQMQNCYQTRQIKWSDDFWTLTVPYWTLKSHRNCIWMIINMECCTQISNASLVAFISMVLWESLVYKVTYNTSTHCWIESMIIPLQAFWLGDLLNYATQFTLLQHRKQINIEVMAMGILTMSDEYSITNVLSKFAESMI